MVSIKTAEEIQIMREGGKILATILRELEKISVVGVSTKKINEVANELCEKYKVIPVFLNYTPYGADRPFPASICVSINDEIVHGIPNESDKVLRDGDIVALDMGIDHKGMIVDSAITVAIGEIDDCAKELLRVTKQALKMAIDKARAGMRTGDIGEAVENFVRPFKFGIPKELGGHGVGHSIHEDPFVPNFGKRGQGVILRPGMTIAIEPMLNEGSKNIYLDKDGYTLRTKDGKRSAHFEHTILITEKEAEILTK